MPRKTKRLSRILQLTVTLVIGVERLSGQSQTYYYTGQVSGYTEADLNPEAWG